MTAPRSSGLCVRNLMTVVMKIENLWKEYRLGVFGHGMLFRDVQSWWARARGKEDPNTRVDAVAGSNGKKDRIWALRDVSLEVRQGEVLGIIGRNGAGKSTLLKIITKVTAPTKGTVKIRGRVASLLEVGTGFHPELTGRENVYLNGAILGMTVNEIKRKFDEIVDFSGVEKYIDTPVKRYSSGMYVRLAFAVAAHLECEILLVDEVLAVGDIAFQRKCLDKMKNVATGGRTVIFVSHAMAAVKSLCQKGLLLAHGQTAITGEIFEVVTQYSASTLSSGEAYLRFPASDQEIGFIEAEILDDTGECKKSFSFLDDIYVLVRYQVNQTLRNVNLALVIDWNGSTVFATYDTDLNDELLIQRNPGTYTAKIKLPTDIMKPGSYSVRIVSGHLGVGVIQDVKEALHFKITHEEENMILKSYVEEREGVVVCRARWEVVREANARRI